MNDLVRETLRLVYSSTRPMPAHFTSNGNRKQSFCIEFEPLTAEDDIAMASESWGSIGDFLSIEKRGAEDLTEGQFNTVMRCGEDLMVGAFILTKLGGNSLMVEMKKAVIDDTIETFGKKIENLESVLSGQQVNKYFDYCIDYGHTRAISQNLFEKKSVLTHKNKFTDESITSLIASSSITEKEYEAAKKIVIESGICKATFLQEYFGIGYSKADLLLTLLEAEWIVSASEYPNGRRLLVDKNLYVDKRTM